MSSALARKNKKVTGSRKSKGTSAAAAPLAQVSFRRSSGSAAAPLPQLSPAVAGRNAHLASSLVAAYVAGGSGVRAQRPQGGEPSVVSWTSLLSGLARLRQVDEARLQETCLILCLREIQYMGRDD